MSQASGDGVFVGKPNLLRGLPNGLSKQEVNVLNHVARGLTDKEIARKLGISPRTVHNHLSHAYEKLSAVNRTQAVLNAMRLGLPIGLTTAGS